MMLIVIGLSPRTDLPVSYLVWGWPCEFTGRMRMESVYLGVCNREHTPP